MSLRVVTVCMQNRRGDMLWGEIETIRGRIRVARACDAPHRAPGRAAAATKPRTILQGHAAHTGQFGRGVRELGARL